MEAVKTILAIGKDKSLQDTRIEILERAGYRVYSARTDQEAIVSLESQDSLDVVIICHSVPESRAHYLVARIRMSRPALPVLLLCSGFHSNLVLADAYLHSLDSPDMLLDLVAELTREHVAHLAPPETYFPAYEVKRRYHKRI